MTDPSTAPPAAPSRVLTNTHLARLRPWLERLLPWVSLAMSIAGALAMDRSEARGPLVAAGAAGAWLVFVAISLLHRPRAGAAADATGAVRKLLRVGSTAAGQNLVQLPLFFSAPFYLEASAWTPLQCLFAMLFAGAVAVSAWDPWCARALLHPVLGPVLLTFASFAGLNAALPMLGVPQRDAAWITAATVGVAIPAAQIVVGGSGKPRLGAIAAGLATPLLLVIGGMSAVPPAPLRVVSAGIGTQVVERTLLDPVAQLERSPGELVCWTAVRAPHGLKDDLVHVWRLDGTELRRVELDLRGGRRAGFRTWSRLHVPGRARGLLTCAVETTLGQTLGQTRVVLGP